MEWKTYQTEELKQKYVYRYITIEKLIDFLDTGCLHLTRIDHFEDNLEGIEPFEVVELDQISELSKISESSKMSEEIKDLAIQEILKNLQTVQNAIKARQQKIFVSCWILNDVESFAMWDIYGKTGFALKFEREYFQSLIQNSIQLQTEPTSKLELLISGIVQYQNFEGMHFKEEESTLPYSFFRKHLSFNHEIEYRIVGCGEDLDTTGLKFKLPELEDLDFELIANPRLDQFQFGIYDGILSKYSKKHVLKESELKRWLNFRNIDF